MTDDPVDLDARRGMAARQATEVRRQDLERRHAGVAADKRRQEEIESLLLAAPAETWLEASARFRYLIGLFAETREAQEPRRQRLISRALDDLDQLTSQPPPFL